MFCRILTRCRPDAVSGSPSAASGPLGLRGGSQVDAPLLPPAALFSSAVRRLCVGLPRFHGGSEGDRPPWRLSLPPLLEEDIRGCPASASCTRPLPPGRNIYPDPGSHKARRPRELRLFSPLCLPPRPQSALVSTSRNPPESASPSAFCFLRLQPHPGPPDPSQCCKVVTEGGGPRPAEDTHWCFAWAPSLSFVRRVL